jgi:hypothetical protein
LLACVRACGRAAAACARVVACVRERVQRARGVEHRCAVADALGWARRRRERRRQRRSRWDGHRSGGARVLHAHAHAHKRWCVRARHCMRLRLRACERDSEACSGRARKVCAMRPTHVHTQRHKCARECAHTSTHFAHTSARRAHRRQHGRGGRWCGRGLSRRRVGWRKRGHLQRACAFMCVHVRVLCACVRARPLGNKRSRKRVRVWVRLRRGVCVRVLRRAQQPIVLLFLLLGFMCILLITALLLRCTLGCSLLLR